MDFTTPPPNMQPVAIYEDGGGLVDKYRIMAAQYRLEGRQVKILGSCRSACVLALSVPNVCVGPGAVVKAHHAYEEKSGKVRPDITASMMQDLPYNIRSKIEPNIGREYNSGSTLTYRELIGLGIPDCSKTKVATNQVDPSKFRKVKSVKVVAQTPMTNPITQFFNIIRSKIDGPSQAKNTFSH